MSYVNSQEETWPSQSAQHARTASARPILTCETKLSFGLTSSYSVVCFDIHRFLLVFLREGS